MLPALPPLAELRAAARAAWPERRLERFRVHDQGGTNLVLEADGSIIFRFPRWRAAAEALGFEVRALEFLSHHLSAPIPSPIRIAVLRRPRGWPFLAYPKLPGKALSEVRTLDSTAHRRLGEFLETILTELAALPSRPLLRMGATPGTPQAWEKKYRELQGRYHRVAESQASPFLRQALAGEFARFYSALQGTRYRAVATHQDLGPDHILWDPALNRPTGVIDWSDLRLGDPAFDLTGLARVGRARHPAWTRARRATEDSTFDERLAFYRRVMPLHDALYAAEIGNARLLRTALSHLATGLRGSHPRSAGRRSSDAAVDLTSHTKPLRIENDG